MSNIAISQIAKMSCTQLNIADQLGQLTGGETPVGDEAVTVFPFVVGAQRSGTTLVRALFDSHPDLAIPGESHFVVPMLRRRYRYERNGYVAVDSFLADLMDSRRFRQWALREDEVRDALAHPMPTNLPDALRRVFSLYAHKQGKSRYGDKTPKYVLSIGLLAAQFPESRFLHVVRDGRDVALAYLDKYPRSTLAEAALHWKRNVIAGRRIGKVLGPGRYREVRYESLVQDPENAVKSLCPFIEIEYKGSMLRYFERAEEIVSSFYDPGLHDHLFLPPTKGLRDWRNQMQLGDLQLFEVLAGSVLSRLGYERAVSKAPVSVGIRGFGKRLQISQHEFAAGFRRQKGRLTRLARALAGQVK